MAHLVTAPQADVTSFLVDIDGTVTESTPQITDSETGEKRLFLDLTGIAQGDHHVTVTAKNLWGESNPVPFDFTVKLPSAPSGIGLEP